MLENHLARLEEGVEARAAEVLDKLVQEEKYKEIDAALRRSLESSIQSKVKNGLAMVAAFNVLLLLAIAAASRTRK
jgi:hypothetical protein